MIVGLIGYKGAGKTTISEAACKLLPGWTRIGFADPLVAAIEAIGVPLEYTRDKSKWDEPLDILCGKSVRHAVNTIGTEWGRTHIGADIWAKMGVAKALSIGGNVIIDNVRKMNELEAIKNAGGVLIRFHSSAGEPAEKDMQAPDKEIRQLWELTDEYFMNWHDVSISNSSYDFAQFITYILDN